MGSKDSGLTGEFGALPQLDRPPVGIDGYDRAGLAAGGAESLDGPAARQKSLELVRAAVELADRVESQARDAAAEQLRRADDESSRRRGEIEARELEFERVRQDLERQHQQAAEATHAAQALLERAQHEAAQTLEQARAEAARVLEEARAEANGFREQASAEAEALRQSEHEKVEQAVKQAVQQANDVQLAEVQSPQPTNGAVKDDPEPRFAPPPLSPEDLASGTLPRFVQRPGAQR